jgi:SPP1 gp7 family putative phage head morphogenesis protein
MNRLIGDVMDNLRQSYEEGYGYNKAAERLEDVFTNMETSELEMVARTEIAGHENLGMHEANIELGVEYEKWKTARDADVRDSHQDLEGQIVRVGDRFSNGLEYPGDRSGSIEEWINCRCTLMPFLMPEGYTAPSGMDYFYESDLVPQENKEEIKPEWKPTMTQEEAEKWAKDSKYGNERFYHGTSQSSANLINDKGFDIDYIRKHNPNGKASGIGHYFTTDKGYASAYAESKQSVLEVVTNIKNPIPLKEYNEIKRTAYDLSSILEHFKDKPYRAVLKELKDMGYEGFVKAMENITAKQYKEYIGLSKTAKNSVELKDLIQLNNMLDKGYDSIRFGEQANLLVVFDDKAITVVK